MLEYHLNQCLHLWFYYDVTASTDAYQIAFLLLWKYWFCFYGSFLKYLSFAALITNSAMLCMSM